MMWRSSNRIVLVGLAAFLSALQLPIWSQPPAANPNERRVELRPHAQDKSGIWTLDFIFRDPRVVTVDIPGRGRRLVWYLWYQVANNTGAPRTFHPDCVWVCHDESSVHQDRLLHTAQFAIRRREDPANLLDIKNCVTISKEPIPLSNEFDDDGQRIAYPKLVTGVATWDDIDPKCDRFSIFVFGLSDGFKVVDGLNGGEPVYRRKTLQIKYKRLGDETNPTADEIRFVGYDWIYATTETPAPLGGGE